MYDRIVCLCVCCMCLCIYYIYSIYMNAFVHVPVSAVIVLLFAI